MASTSGRAKRYWEEKLPQGYVLKRLRTSSDYWWVDGICGYQVSRGTTPAEAVGNALQQIKEKESMGKAILQLEIDRRVYDALVDLAGKSKCSLDVEVTKALEDHVGRERTREYQERSR
jgi:hypothetical protein